MRTVPNRILILILGAIILSPVIASAEYAYQKPIMIDHTKVSATLTNFPVLVSISNDNDLKNHVTSVNGYDLVFKDGSGTKLAHELERWDGSTGTLVAWVKIPSLSSATDRVIYMLYGDSGVTTSQENKTGVWDSNFKGIWHLKEVSGPAKDSTSNSNDLSSTGNTTFDVEGTIGKAVNFGSSGGKLYGGSSISPTSQMTLSAWINPSSLGGGEGGWDAIAGKVSNSNWNDGFILYYQGGLLQFSKSIYSTAAKQSFSTIGSWSYVAGTYDSSDGVLRLYINANTPATMTTSGNISTNGSNFQIGLAPAYNYRFNGVIDEVRISSVARSTDWILTEYRNQSSPSTFYTVGSESQSSDITVPVVTALVFPNVYNNLAVPITTFTATDNVGVTEYLVNESPSIPSLSDPNWSATPQTQYIFPSDGNKTLFAWARDAAGNISDSLSKAVLVVIGARIYVYDELNRLVQVIYEDGSEVTYTYDWAGNRLGTGIHVIDTTPPTTTVSPLGGTYNTAQTVTLTCNDGTGSGCDKIYYTIDGTTPTTSSPVYSSAINISITTTLKFFATDFAGNSEAVKGETYTISTNMVTVELKDSTGNPLNGGVVQYYSGGWQTFGTTDASGQVSKELQLGTYTFSMTYAYARQEKAQNIATNRTVVFQTINVTIQLKDSAGALMDIGTVQYYSGGWHNIGTTSGGQISKELLPVNYTFSMNYAFARQEKSQNVATNPTVAFQTTRVLVELRDSFSSLTDTGTVQYYSAGWRDIGNTSGGQVSKELLPATYTFSMNYAYVRQEKSQNIVTNPTVVFQTIKVAVQLRDSTNNLIDTGTVQYYSGGWRDIGNTSGGQVSKELLPGSYTFSMNYAFSRQEKAQNIAANPTVIFQTTSAMVQLKDSTGALMDTGTVQYYSGGWHNIGTTSGGQVSKELLPGSYTFSMNYAFGRQEKSQNIAANPTVIFQTINATIQLKDSTGALMDTGTVQYYSGGWHNIGSTSGGQVSKELLPGSYTFSMNYSFARQEKPQNIATNPAVVFQTIRVTIELRDSANILIDTGIVQYYSGGWRDIGSTLGGQISKEFLPGSYTFSMNYAFGRQEKSQNTTANPTVLFQTGQVQSDSGSCTHYYAGGWRTFVQEMELLPLTYTFRFNDGTPNTSYKIITGTVNHIH
jgi:YD repeat-containing protein